jgi:hypothetical protein
MKGLPVSNHLKEDLICLFLRGNRKERMEQSPVRIAMEFIEEVAKLVIEPHATPGGWWPRRRMRVRPA